MQPEGRFLVHYAFVQDNPARSIDSSYDLISTRLGLRIGVWPGISGRAVGEITGDDPSRRIAALRLGYAEWIADPVGTFRIGQAPTVWGDAEEQILIHPIFGLGVSIAGGFLAPAGLGGSFGRDVGILDVGTGSIEVGAYLTDGLIGAGATSPSAADPSGAFIGSGPAAQVRVGFAPAGGGSVHLFGRYGLVLDEQVGLAGTFKIGEVDLMGEVAASASNPAPFEMAGDIGAMVGAKYNLGNVWQNLWRFDLVGRVQAIDRNVTDVRRDFTGFSPIPSALPVASQSTTINGLVGLLYRITDSAAVGMDVSTTRITGAGATSSVMVGVRLGVSF